MAASAVINILALGVGGLLSAPALIDFFATPLPDKIVVNIGVGATNSSEPLPNGQDLKGNAPRVTLYDINGVEIGSGTNDAIIEDGGAVSIVIEGKEGSSASKLPQYIQLTPFGDDPVCISWLTTSSSSSSGADFRSWNGAAAKFCRVPWYPSVAPMPGVTTLFQPPCFWLGSGGDFVVGMSARLTDFFFPGTAAGQSNATATQWQQFPDTLCKAPGRQQFYKNNGVCIPFYPSGLSIVNQKDPETGFDADFNAVQSSHTQTCSVAGIPFNNVDLGAGKPDPNLDVLESIIATASLNSVINLGPLGRRAAAPTTDSSSGGIPLATAASTETPSARVTDAAKLPERKPQPQPEARKMKEPVLDRTVEKRHEEPDRWCQLHHLVVSEHLAHSAVEVCESDSSWGPDFVALNEGLFCDMCTRKVYPICGSDSGHVGILAGGMSASKSSTEDADTMATAVAAAQNGRIGIPVGGMPASKSTSKADVTVATVPNSKATEVVKNTPRSTAGHGNVVCFNMKTKQLRVPPKLRRSVGTVPVKRYQVVKHWK